MRIGEFLALNDGNFDFEKNLISVTKNRMRINGEISTQKTKYIVRVIDMPPAIMQEVRNYINSLDEVTTPLFTIEFSTLSAASKKYAAKADLKPIRIHDLYQYYKIIVVD